MLKKYKFEINNIFEKKLYDITFISLLIYMSHKLNFYKNSVEFSSYAVGSMGAYWLISRFISLIN